MRSHDQFLINDLIARGLLKPASELLPKPAAAPAPKPAAVPPGTIGDRLAADFRAAFGR